VLLWWVSRPGDAGVEGEDAGTGAVVDSAPSLTAPR
jgi:hypothetical protein